MTELPPFVTGIAAMYERDALHGIVVGSTAEWHRAGLSRRHLASLIDSGHLAMVRRGAYATASILARAAEDPRLAHAVAVAGAIATGRNGGAGSHYSAARIYGIDLLSTPEGDAVALTLPPGARTGRPGRNGQRELACHVAALPDAHVTEAFFGVRVTTGSRTVVDIARKSTFMAGVVAMDSALLGRHASRAEIRRVLTAGTGWPGIDKARKVADFASGLSESVLESCARVVFHEYGLPTPELQLRVHDSEGKVIARPDFCWPRYRTIADTDGLLKYQSSADMARHLNRDSMLQLLGWQVVHVTWGELFGKPDSVISRIKLAFSRSARPARRPG